MREYRVTQIVQETACVEANSKTEAIAKVTENGANWDRTVIKETAVLLGARPAYFRKKP